MKEDILLQKIGRELSNLPIDTEPRVMYLLVEIRKVLEYEQRFGLLRFYCDWVVHTKLDRNPAQKIFDKLNRCDTESSLIISFNKLKSELEEFLKDKNLPTEIIDIHWEPFKDKMIDILVDTPIEKKDVVGSFFYRRTGVSGVEFGFKDKKGIKSLGRIIE